MSDFARMQGKRAIEILSVAAVLVSFLAVGCAKRVAPSGGPVDKTPPEIAESVPQNGAVNFPADGEIFVRFSEPVKANRDAVLIFPPESVEINFGKNLVKIRPREKFRENTTYTLIFTPDFSDRHGNNLKSPLTIAFSTGDHIDTLSISGQVIDALSLKPVAGALVAALTDSELSPSAVVRVGFAGENGRFVLGNLAPKKYYLCALSGTGTKFDPISAEKISSPTEPVPAGETLPHCLVMIPNDTTAPQVLSVSAAAPNVVKLTLSEFADIRRMVTENLLPWYFPADSKEVFIKISGGIKKIPLPLCDRWGNCAETTLALPDSFPPDTLPPAPVIFGKFFSLFPGQNLIIPFVEPIEGDFRAVMHDTLVPCDVRKPAPNAVEIEFAKIPPPGDSILIIADSLCDLFGNCAAETLVCRISNEKPGEVEISGDFPCQNPKIFLWNGKKRFFARRADGGFACYVPAGEYSLWCLCDENSDGRWTSGRWSPFAPGEEIFLYPDTISVRAGWKTQVNWRIPQ